MNIVIPFVIMISVIVFMKYLLKAAKAEPPKNELGYIILKMNKAYGVAGYIGILFTIVITMIAAMGNIKTIEDLTLFAVIILFFLVLSVPLVLMARNVSIEANNEEIIFTGALRNCIVVKWNDIKAVAYSKFMTELVLLTDEAKVKVHLHLIGFPSFVTLMKRNLEPARYKEALRKAEKVMNS